MNSASAATIRDRVRSETRAIHDALEELPLSRAIVAEEIDQATYVRLLACLIPLHRVLEAALAEAPALAAFAVEASRASLLERDLESLGGSAVSSPEAEAVASQLERMTQEGTPELLAAAYVVVGSRMGGIVLQGCLARALGLRAGPGGGLEYHTEGAPGFPKRWRALCQELDLHLDGPLEGRRFGAAAVTTMQAFYTLYQAVGRGLQTEAA